jgi:hypothetical protein
VMAHGDAWEGKWRGNWRMEWVASTLHTTSEHGVSSITTAHAHTLAASSWLNWRPRRFKWTRPFRQKAKSGYCACAITFQTQSTMIQNPTVRSEFFIAVNIKMIFFWNVAPYSLVDTHQCFRYLPWRRWEATSCHITEDCKLTTTFTSLPCFSGANVLLLT